MAEKLKTKLDFSWGKHTDTSKIDEKIRGLSNEEAAAVTHVFLQHNELTSAPSLARLKNVKLVDLSSNLLASAPDLTALPLETLYLQNNRLEDVSKLRGLAKLDVLWLENNPALGDKAVNLGKPFHEEHAKVQALIKK